MLEIPENTKSLLIFEGTTNLNELLKHIYSQINLYATQNGTEFATNPEEICAFLGISYMMSTSKLPNVKCYRSVDSCQSNDGARNAVTRNCFINICTFYVLLIIKQLINLAKLIRYVLS